MITRVATTGAGELFAVRHEDGTLYHHRLAKGGATIAEPIASEEEESFLAGCEKHGWDMTPVEFPDWDHLHAARTIKNQAVLEAQAKLAKNWDQPEQ